MSPWRAQYQWIQLKPDVPKQTLLLKPGLQHPPRGSLLDVTPSCRMQLAELLSNSPLLARHRAHRWAPVPAPSALGSQIAKGFMRRGDQSPEENIE